MKQAIFTVVDNGQDGRAPSNIVFASTDEAERDEWYNNHRNKPYFTRHDVVKDLDKVAGQVKARLNGLEKLALGFEQSPVRKRPVTA